MCDNIPFDNYDDKVVKDVDQKGYGERREFQKEDYFLLNSNWHQLDDD